MGELQTDESDNHEVIVLRDTLKDVQLPVQSPRVYRVKYLSKHERIEHQSLNNCTVVAGDTLTAAAV